jgi:hypothetical protein
MPNHDDDLTPPERPMGRVSTGKMAKQPKAIDEGWGSPLPDKPAFAIEKRRRGFRETITSTRSKITAAMVPLLGALAVSITSWVESCNASRAAASVTDRVDKNVPKVEKQAQKTDHELGAAYGVLADHMKEVEDGMKSLERRQALLEQLVIRTSSHPAARRYKPPRPAAKPAPELPASPAAAAAQADFGASNIHEDR